MPTSKENPLSLSQRSNNLQFSRSSYFQPAPSQFLARSVYLYTDPRSVSGLTGEHGRPTKKHQSNAYPSSEKKTAGSPPPPYTRRAISSLITPYTNHKPPKRMSKTSHGLSSSASSTRSATSSILSLKRKYYYEHPKLQTLPAEILDEIFSYLPQSSLLSLIKTSKRLLEEAAHTLYAYPSFASTYRFAQFVSVVSQNRGLAEMLRVLDLSTIRDPENEAVPMAGWREWKYRNSPLHTIQRSDDLKTMTNFAGLKKKGSTSSSYYSLSPNTLKSKANSNKSKNKSNKNLGTKKKSTGIIRSTHPHPSPFLKQYSLSRDVPIGAIIHLLTACPYIRHLNLSHLPLAADYSVLSTTESYTPAAFTGKLFVSDVPKSFTWKENDTVPLIAAVDLTDAIVGLRALVGLKAKGGLWLTKDAARRIVCECRMLENVDFRECGMSTGTRWAVEGSPGDVEKILESGEGGGEVSAGNI